MPVQVWRRKNVAENVSVENKSNLILAIFQVTVPDLSINIWMHRMYVSQ